MERKLTFVALFVAAALCGCGAPEGSEGKTVSADELNRLNRAAAQKDDSIKPPTPPSDGGPGSGPR